VYVKPINKGIMFLTLYDDIILLARKNLKMIETTKRRLSFVFDKKDAGEGTYVLVMEVVRDYLLRCIISSPLIVQLRRVWP